MNNSGSILRKIFGTTLMIIVIPMTISLNAKPYDLKFNLFYPLNWEESKEYRILGDSIYVVDAHPIYAISIDSIPFEKIDTLDKKKLTQELKNNIVVIRSLIKSGNPKPEIKFVILDGYFFSVYTDEMEFHCDNCCWGKEYYKTEEYERILQIQKLIYMYVDYVKNEK